MRVATLRIYKLNSIDEFIKNANSYKETINRKSCYEIIDTDKGNERKMLFFKNEKQYICNISFFKYNQWLKTKIYGAYTWTEFKKMLHAIKSGNTGRYLIIEEFDK